MNLYRTFVMMLLLFSLLPAQTRVGAGLYAGDWFETNSGTGLYEDKSVYKKLSLYINHSFFDERISIGLKTGFNPFTINREFKYYEKSSFDFGDTLFTESTSYQYVVNWMEFSIPVDVPVFAGFFMRAEPAINWQPGHIRSTVLKMWFVNDTTTSTTGSGGSMSDFLDTFEGFSAYPRRKEVKREVIYNDPSSFSDGDFKLRYAIGYKRENFKVLVESSWGKRLIDALGLTVEYEIRVREKKRRTAD